jgi:protoporphyrinogen oxidase
MAAWRAAHAGHEVTVVERSSRVGGMAASHSVAGLRVDLGSHRLHPSTPPAILDALRSLLGDDLQERPRNGRVRLGDRWIAFPLRATDLVTRTPRAFAAGALRDAVLAPTRRPRADTFAEVVRAGLGPTVADAFYAPYVRKIWGVDPTALSAELARRRVSAGGPAAIARRVVRARRPEGRTFLYPRRGFGQLAERIADAAVGAGATIRCGLGVEHVALRPDGATVRVTGGEVIDADRVWSTAPLPELATRTEPAPDPTVLDAARRLTHRAVVLAYLVLDRPRWTEFDAHYFPAEDIPMARLSEPRNYRDSAEDPPDRTVLCAELPCDVGDATWEAGEAELGERVAAALARLDLPPVATVHTELVRLPRVYPVYRPGFEWDLSALDLWAADQPTLLTFGRQGLFVPDNSHHAFEMGWAAAGALRPDGSFDQAAWTEARSRFRTFIVED